MKKFLILVLLFLIQNSVSASPSLDEMIGQMLITGFHGKTKYSHSYQKTKHQIKKGEIGGVILFEHNIKNPSQLLSLTTDLKDIKSKQKPFISIDQEGGIVARMHENNGFKNHLTAYKIASTKTPEQAYMMYYDLAQMCCQTGFNLNFTPDVDLLLNPDSIIAKKERSFSKDEKVVTEYAKECLKAHYDSGVVTSLKHFPGHGSPVGDTHKGFVDASNTWQEQELFPYKKLAKTNDLQMVMVSHIYVKKLDDKFPASLSKNIVQGLLREQMGFDGVVITDDLHMGAIRNNYSLEEIVINSINAGNDILLFSNYNKPDINTPKKVNKIIKKAIKNGKISQSQIENSYNRIITLKKNMENKKK